MSMVMVLTAMHLSCTYNAMREGISPAYGRRGRGAGVLEDEPYRRAAPEAFPVRVGGRRLAVAVHRVHGVPAFPS